MTVRTLFRQGTVALAIFFAVLATGCTGPRTVTIPVDYRSWELSTTLPLDYTIPGHGDGLRRIYANQAAFTAMAGVKDKGGSVNYPDGTVFVKEVYGSPSPTVDEEPAMLTVMIKDSGAPEARGGWLWIVKPLGGSGSTVRLVEAEFCLTCHANANERHPYGEGNSAATYQDFIFFPPGLVKAAGNRN